MRRWASVKKPLMPVDSGTHRVVIIVMFILFPALPALLHLPFPFQIIVMYKMPAHLS
jgi:hypothetical protein